MPNAQTLAQFLAHGQYVGEGVLAAIESVARFLPLDVERGDTLAIATYGSEFTTSGSVIVDSGAGSRPLAVVVQSQGTACYVRMYDLSTTSTLTGSGDIDPDVVIPVATATGETTTVSFQGPSWEAFWNVGLCMTVSTLGAHALTPPAAPPRVFILYRNV